MGLFTQYVDELPAVSLTQGNTTRIPLTRDFPREGFALRFRGTCGSTRSNLKELGLLNLAKRIRLVVNDGSTTRSIVDADGLSILQRHIHYNQSVNRSTIVEVNRKAAGATWEPGNDFDITIPHFFAPGVLNSPTRDLFLQNFPRYNNDPYLEIETESAASLGNGGGDQVITNFTVQVTEFKRVVNIPNWNFLNVVFESFLKEYTLDAPNQRYQIPIPGYHFCIGVRPYGNLATGSLDDISRTNGLIKISALNQVERSLSYSTLQGINEWSDNPLSAIPSNVDPDGTADVQNAVANSAEIVRPTAFFDYLTDQTGSDVTNLDTLFNTNAFVNIGATPEIIWDIAGGANKAVMFMHDRCFGDITGALALLKVANNGQKK